MTRKHTTKRLITTFILIFTYQLFGAIFEDFEYTESNGKVTITEYNGTEKTVTIPYTINNKPVVSIGYRAFYYCRQISSVTIPSTVTSLADHAFGCCSSLETITIPSALTSIGQRAFYCCDKLTTINLGSSIESIGKEAFSGCKALKIIELPNSLNDFGDEMFAYCDTLQSVKLPDSVTSLGNRTFYNCQNLETITISNALDHIHADAFHHATNIKRVIITPSDFDCLTDLSFGSTSIKFNTSLSTGQGENLIRSNLNYHNNIQFDYQLTNLTLSVLLMDSKGYRKRFEIPVDSETISFNWNTQDLMPGLYSIVGILMNNESVSVGKSKSTILVPGRSNLDQNEIISSNEVFEFSSYNGSIEETAMLISEWAKNNQIESIAAEVGESEIQVIRRFLEIPNERSNELLVEVDITSKSNDLLPLLFLVNEQIPDGYQYLADSFSTDTPEKNINIQKKGDILSCFYAHSELEITSFTYRLIKSSRSEAALSFLGSGETPNFSERVKGNCQLTATEDREWIVSLTAGWNLISLPFNCNKGHLLGVNTLWLWNTELQEYTIGNEIKLGQAAWIYSESSRTIQIDGPIISTYTPSLKQGWNMIGLLYEEKLGNSLAFQYLTHQKHYQSARSLVPGKGYWKFQLNKN